MRKKYEKKTQYNLNGTKNDASLNDEKLSKTISKLNSPKRLRRDFIYAPNISEIDNYNFLDYFKNDRLNLLFEKKLFRKDIQPFKKQTLKTHLFNVKTPIRNLVAAVLTTAVLGVSTYATYLGYTYVVPLIEQAYVDYETSKLPPHKEQDNYDFNVNKPSNIINSDNLNNQNGSATEPTENQSPILKVEIDEATLTSYSNLINNNIKETVNLYFGEDANIIPMFVYTSKSEDDMNQINLVCKKDDGESILLQYDVYDDDVYDKLFNSSFISASNAITTLNYLLDEGNLSDLPQIKESFSMNNSIFSHTSDVKKITEGTIIEDKDENGNILGGTYIETTYYKFNTISLNENGEIIKQNVKIVASDAENMEGFDFDNLSSVVNLFIKSQNNFEIESETLCENANLPTVLIYNANQSVLNAKQTKKESVNNFSQEMGK